MIDDESRAGRDAARRARFRLDALIALLVASIVLVSACGSPASSGSSSALPSLQNLTTKALSYAKCMRSHGIQNFPDPTVVDNAHSKGVGFRVPPADQNSPQFSSAAKACKASTGFGVIDPAVLQAAMNAGVKFAGCMRSHGIANYPDPVENGHGIQLGPGPGSGIDTNSARYKAAQKACFALLPNGGP